MAGLSAVALLQAAALTLLALALTAVALTAVAPVTRRQGPAVAQPGLAVAAAVASPSCQALALPLSWPRRRRLSAAVPLAALVLALVARLDWEWRGAQLRPTTLLTVQIEIVACAAA